MNNDIDPAPFIAGNRSASSRGSSAYRPTRPSPAADRRLFVPTSQRIPAPRVDGATVRAPRSSLCRSHSGAVGGVQFAQ